MRAEIGNFKSVFCPFAKTTIVVARAPRRAHIVRAMIDAIKKTMLAGVGAAVITKEKAEAAFADWVKKGKISAEDAKSMASKLADEGRAEFERSSAETKQTVRELLDKAGVGQKDRIDALEKRLLALEVEVANLATRGGGSDTPTQT